MSARDRTIVHVAFSRDWERAQETGRYDVSTRDATLAEVGFVHASSVAQMSGTLDRFFGDVDRSELVVLVLDVERLEAAGSPVRWEPVSGQPGLFPHVYGPIPTDAVVGVHSAVDL